MLLRRNRGGPCRPAPRQSHGIPTNKTYQPMNSDEHVQSGGRFASRRLAMGADPKPRSREKWISGAAMASALQLPARNGPGILEAMIKIGQLKRGEHYRPRFPDGGEKLYNRRKIERLAIGWNIKQIEH